VGFLGVIAVYLMAEFTKISVINMMAFIGFAAAVDNFAKELIISIILKQDKGLVEKVIKAVEDDDNRKT
jgi:hypothetical protein